MLYEVREFLASYDATPVMVMATIPVASKRICGLAVRDEIFFGRLGGKFEKLRNLNFMNGILLRLKIDPAAVQSPRGSNALQAVQTLFGSSLKNTSSLIVV